MSALIVCLGLSLLFVVSVNARGDKYKTEGKTTHVRDVEELLDQKAKLDNKSVSVSGEIEEVLDERTFILESGGLFDDEVVVFMDKNVQADELNRLIKEDKELIVNGTFKRATVAEIEREHDWKFSSDSKKKLKKSQAYILGSQLSEQLAE